jgi:ABC-type glycerol-3-phosphate transport system permease component
VWRLTSRRLVAVALRGGLALAAAAVLSPLLWAAWASLRGGVGVRTEPFAIPSPPVLDSYRAALSGGLLTDLWHSMELAGCSVLVAVTLASLAAYAFARLSFRGSAWLRLLIVSGMMVPIHAVLIPLFVTADRLHLAGTPFALVGPYVAFSLPLSVLLLTAYFAAVPREIEDSARIDGCSDLRIWWSIVLPISRPGLVTVALLQGIWVWNEFPLALVMLSGEWRTLPVGLAAFRGEFHMDWGAVLAGVTIVAAPLLAVFFLLQRAVMQGMSAGAVKE